MSRMRNGNGHYAHHANSVRRKIRGSRARMQDMRFYEATQDRAHLTGKSNEPHARAVGSSITPVHPSHHAWIPLYVMGAVLFPALSCVAAKHCRAFVPRLA
jgi:hypothetical protein